ncbi:MAG: hypothetical protein LLG04_09365 [Parachlamydia sp.]|nr:hypothetical protein [Parachlamydia sp.]
MPGLFFPVERIDYSLQIRGQKTFPKSVDLVLHDIEAALRPYRTHFLSKARADNFHIAQDHMVTQILAKLWPTYAGSNTSGSLHVLIVTTAIKIF